MEFDLLSYLIPDMRLVGMHIAQSPCLIFTKISPLPLLSDVIEKHNFHYCKPCLPQVESQMLMAKTISIDTSI